LHYSTSRICVRRAEDSDFTLLAAAFGSQHFYLATVHLCFDNDEFVAASGRTHDGRVVLWSHPGASRMATSVLRAVAL
jgi:hypothetical protein